MFPRAQLIVLYLRLTSFIAKRLVSSRSEAVSPNNEAKNTKGQVWFTAKHRKNTDVIAAHVRPPLGCIGGLERKMSRVMIIHLPI